MADEMSVDIGGGRERKVRVDYPSNSQKSKIELPDREPIEKIVTGDVVQRKKSWGSRFHDTFISEGGDTVMNYVVMEVLVPAAKNMISDAVSQGIERLMFGGDSRARGPQGARPGYTSYSSYGKPATVRQDQARTMSRQARSHHDFGDIILASRAEAEDVLDRLRDLVSQYQMATVSDLYDLVGVSGEFTDDKWGWYDLRSASVRPIRGGYLLIMPRTQPIV